LLEHKKELKTRELLNFLEQSALNGKEKAFLMRHLERDLDKIEAKIKEKESVKESETIDNAKEQSLFNEEANFKANFKYETQEAKQKTINKVDEYAKSEAFKALSKDKQEAILSLKSIKPSIMPENIKIQDLQHLQEHFKGKLDEKQREKFLSLFNDTKQNADLVLEVLKNGEKRQEYIKAYQHKESKDLYYIAISKDERDITGIPTTQIQKIINDIAKSERVIKAENFGEISNTAAPLPKQTSPQRSGESIPQNNKALDYYSKKLSELSDEHNELVMKSFSHTLNKAEQARLNLLKEELIQNKALKRQEINTLASQKITKYNDLLKTLKDSFNNRQMYNDIYVDLLGNTDELIEILKKDDEKIGLFIHQLYDPLKNDNELHGAGISYKAKKLKNGDIRVTGGGISDAKLQKSIRLSKMERERLHLAFAREYNMQGFINDSHREDFFKRLDRAVSKYYDDFHLDRVDYKKYLYSQDRILESDSITQAKQKLEKEREAFREFLEQSATKEANKELKSDLLDKTKPLRKAEKEELTKEVLEQVQKENLKLYLNHTNENLTHFLKLEKPLKITMRGANIKHILNKHGENSTLAKNGQPFVSLEDIKNYDEYINNADKQILKENDKGEKTLLSGKQINGYYIVISSVRLKNGELKLKTMYKENGKLENNEAFKGVKLPSETPSVLQGQSLTTNLDGYPSHASESIAQKPQQKALNLQEIEQTLKARMSQINDEILAIDRAFEDKAFREKLKEASKVKPILEALKKEWKALEPFIVTWTHTDYSKFKPKKYYNRRPNLSNLWHIEETLDVYKGYARENERQAKQVEREITLLEKYVKLLKDKEAEAKKLETDKKALLTESYIIPVYNKLREAFKNGQHTTEQILEAKNIDIKRDSFIAKGIINEIAQLRQYLEQFFNITPLKEFGTNYAEFYKDGKGAIQKLLAEKGGQVSGAFYKEGLGDIDLVWGDDSFGLKHILNKHGDEFENIAEELDKIIQNGEVVKTHNGYNITLGDYKVGLNIGWNQNGVKIGENKWVVTAFDNSKLQSEKQGSNSASLTKGETLPLNS
ncbi:hypothetical protein CUPS4258_09475, partial [Campylobacter upsaliensis]|nr:hypothetical protein [Campylobacter upsaliensis]